MSIIARYGLALCLMAGAAHDSTAQEAQYAFRVSFSDKNATTHTLSAPSAYLSQRALDRRARFGIAVDSSDLPVPAAYIDSVLQRTQGVLHNSSRWHNTCVILTGDPSLASSLVTLPFVKEVSSVGYYANGLHERPGAEEPGETTGERPTGFDENYYGAAWSQIHLCHGEYLHEQGYRGQGMLIASIDVGFTGVATGRAFDSLFENGRLADTWNYIYDTAHVFGYSAHGCQTLSCMASLWPEVHVGTAPGANYALYATDDAGTEQAIEEDNFAAAAERADSIGADLISTSLGYNIFDNTDFYTYAQLDGHTTVSARTANTAVRKGIMVVASAGNEGLNPWQHILTPGDADSVMTVGSVNNQKIHAASSGQGPNAAGLLKPNVSAQGVQAAVISQAGSVSIQSGTSFATPVLAGLTACLMQAAPDRSPMEIRALIESVSDAVNNPDNNIGNGVPDFRRALQLVTSINGPGRNDADAFLAFPNPAAEKVFILCRQPGRLPLRYTLYDMSGRQLLEGTTVSGGSIPVAGLGRGIYLLQLSNGRQEQRIKLQLR